jgi:hypothetical protein
MKASGLLRLSTPSRTGVISAGHGQGRSLPKSAAGISGNSARLGGGSMPSAPTPAASPSRMPGGQVSAVDIPDCGMAPSRKMTSTAPERIRGAAAVTTDPPWL